MHDIYVRILTQHCYTSMDYVLLELWDKHAVIVISQEVQYEHTKDHD